MASKAQKQSQEEQSWLRAPGAPKHFVSSGNLEMKLFQIRRGHTLLIGFYFRKRSNDSDIVGGKMERIVLLGLFPKQGDMWVSLGFWGVLGFPREQVMEMIEKQIKANSFKIPLWLPLFQSMCCIPHHQHSQDKMFLSSWKSR